MPGPHQDARPALGAVACRTSLITSNARPATSGMPSDARGEQPMYQSGLPSGANTKMATIITISRKLVPQRGCRREKRWAFSGVSVEAGLVAGDRLVLGAVVLEHALEVLHARDQPQVAEEDRDADELLDDHEDEPVRDRVLEEVGERRPAAGRTGRPRRSSRTRRCRPRCRRRSPALALLRGICALAEMPSALKPIFSDSASATTPRTSGRR